MKKLSDLLGLKIVAVKGFRHKIDKRVKNPQIEPQYILFDDCKTFICLEEQDPYSYHDCSVTARHLWIREDEEQWSNIMDDDVHHPHANTDI